MGRAVTIGRLRIDCGRLFAVCRPTPKLRAASVLEASEVLASLIDHPGYRFWPIVYDWATLAAPFLERVYGHQQITDAYLLGLAIKEGGVLVTMNKGIRYMAGTQYGKNVLLLE